jgi:3-oxoadipate enol-lactonase
MNTAPIPGNHTVTIEGNRLNVQIEGASEGRWLLFSNSILTDLGVWDSTVSALAPDYRILRYDTRGHGKSSPLDPTAAEATRFDDLVNDVIGLLDHFGIDKVDAIGVSLGGVTVMGLALTAPQRVRSLVVVGSRGDMPGMLQKAWADRIATVHKDGTDAIRESTLNRWFPEDFRAKDPAAVTRVGKMILETSGGGFIAGAASLAKLDYLPRLSAVTVPALLMAGGNDVPTPDAMKAIKAVMPSARLEILDGAGHLLPIDRPAETATAIAGFLKTVAA